LLLVHYLRRLLHLSPTLLTRANRCLYLNNWSRGNLSTRKLVPTLLPSTLQNCSNSGGFPPSQSLLLVQPIHLGNSAPLGASRLRWATLLVQFSDWVSAAQASWTCRVCQCHILSQGECFVPLGTCIHLALARYQSTAVIFLSTLI